MTPAIASMLLLGAVLVGVGGSLGGLVLAARAFPLVIAGRNAPVATALLSYGCAVLVTAAAGAVGYALGRLLEFMFA